MQKYAPVLLAFAAFLIALTKLSPSKTDDVFANLLYRIATALNRTQ